MKEPHVRSNREPSRCYFVDAVRLKLRFYPFRIYKLNCLYSVWVINIAVFFLA